MLELKIFAHNKKIKAMLNNFDFQSSTSHVLSIVIMVNEKFRERVRAWECFRPYDSSKFADLFDKVLKLLASNKEEITFPEQTILVKFLDNCVNSLEEELVRVQVQKICGLAMWKSLSDNRREHEFKKFPRLRKFWKAIEKNDAKLDSNGMAKVQFERSVMKKLMLKFIQILDLFDQKNNESGELMDSDDLKFKMHYLERFLELLIDLEALLPTRRFFNTLLEDTNLLIHCFTSPLHTSQTLPVDSRLFNQLLQTLKFYASFEIDDQTGEAKSEAEMLELHYEKLKALQKGVFKYFRDDLQSFALTNIGTIDKRETLVKHLERLSVERLYSLAEYLHLVPFKNDQ